MAQRVTSRVFFGGSRSRSQPPNQIYIQAFNLIADLTVLENIELPLTYGNMTAG